MLKALPRRPRRIPVATLVWCLSALACGCVSPYDQTPETPQQRLVSRLDAIDLARQQARREGRSLEQLELARDHVQDTLTMLRDGAIAAESVAVVASGNAPEDIGAPGRETFWDSPLNLFIALLAALATVLGVVALRDKRAHDKPRRGLLTRSRLQAQPRTERGMPATAAAPPPINPFDKTQPIYRRSMAISDSRIAVPPAPHDDAPAKPRVREKPPKLGPAPKKPSAEVPPARASSVHDSPHAPAREQSPVPPVKPPRARNANQLELFAGEVARPVIPASPPPQPPSLAGPSPVQTAESAPAPSDKPLDRATPTEPLPTCDREQSASRPTRQPRKPRTPPEPPQSPTADGQTHTEESSPDDIRATVRAAAARGLSPEQIASELALSVDHVKLILRVAGS